MKVTPFILILLLLGTIAFSMPIVSSDEDEDPIDDEDPVDDEDQVDDDFDYEREVDIEQADFEWKIESELKSGDNKDKFDALFKIGGGNEPVIEFNYEQEAGSNETELEFIVEFVQVIEFEDDGIPGYQEGNDTIVSIYELAEIDWNPIVYSLEEIEGVVLYTATATTVDGVFTLVLKLSNNLIQLNDTLNTSLGPNAIKIDVIINGYDYQGNNTYLTIQTDVKTEFEVDIEDSDDEDNDINENEEQLLINSGKVSGFFSWVTIAEVNETIIDVITTDHLEDQDESTPDKFEIDKTLFFTFDVQNANEIIWDPKIGVLNEEVINPTVETTTTDSEETGTDTSEDREDRSVENILSYSLFSLLSLLIIPVLFRRLK
jgi:hypothetical protein